MIVTLPRASEAGRDDDGPLSGSAASRARTWIRRLDAVDTSGDTGWAFTGDFSSFGRTVQVPEGTYFLTYVEKKTSSGKGRGILVRLYRAEDGTLEEARMWKLPPFGGWALHVRDELAQILAETPPPPRRTATAP